MFGIVILVLVTVLYAGYNLFLKVSGGYVPVSATTTVLATIALQLGALFTSVLFLSILVFRGGHVFSLSTPSYLWAVVAGLCIGGAEIGYLYLFGGIGLAEPMPASVVIPVVVSGTVVISLVFSYWVFKEVIGWHQVLGAGLVVLGIFFLFIRSR